MMFRKFLGQIFPQNSALSCLVTSLHDVRVTRQGSKYLSVEKSLFSLSVSTLLCFYRSGRSSCTGGWTLCRHFLYSRGSGKCALLTLCSPWAVLFRVARVWFLYHPCTVACYLRHLVLRVTHGLASFSWATFSRTHHPECRVSAVELRVTELYSAKVEAELYIDSHNKTMGEDVLVNKCFISWVMLL